MMQSAILKIDWQSVFLGSESFSFLPEVLMRTAIMFIVILVGLRMLGKRSVAQLSVFELGVIIGLGSAAGDPMLYKDVGLLPGIITFVVIIGLYRIITYLINHYTGVEKLLEGEPVYVIEHGRLKFRTFEKESTAREELYILLRQHHVTHLGQVQFGLLETNGSLSIVFYNDEDVLWGLPVFPHLNEKHLVRIGEKGIYACAYCGKTEEFEGNGREHKCSSCNQKEWVRAIKERRIE